MLADFDIPWFSNDMNVGVQKIIKWVKFCTEVWSLLKKRASVLFFINFHFFLYFSIIIFGHFFHLCTECSLFVINIAIFQLNNYQ